MIWTTGMSLGTFQADNEDKAYFWVILNAPYGIVTVG
jgi:hypothetical protein